MANYVYVKIAICDLDFEMPIYFCTHTYIIGHYNLVSITTKLLTPLISCVLILCMTGGQFKVDPERHIFEKFFLAILFTFRVLERILLRGSCRRNIFIFFRFDV